MYSCQLGRRLFSQDPVIFVSLHPETTQSVLMVFTFNMNTTIMLILIAYKQHVTVCGPSKVHCSISLVTFITDLCARMCDNHEDCRTYSYSSSSFALKFMLFLKCVRCQHPLVQRAAAAAACGDLLIMCLFYAVKIFATWRLLYMKILCSCIWGNLPSFIKEHSC